MRPATIGAACAALTCATTALAALRDLYTTRLTHGTAWAVTDVLVAAVACAGAYTAVTLAIRDEIRHDIKAGFARPAGTPESRDLEHRP